jgi:hypothetical protein
MGSNGRSARDARYVRPMAKRQTTTGRTSEHASQKTTRRALDRQRAGVDRVPDTIDKARAEAHERARQRSGSDD